MRKALFVVGILVVSAVDAVAQDLCVEGLRSSLSTITQTQASTLESAAFDYLCSTNEGKRNSRSGAGLKISLPIEGVPVSLGGGYDDQDDAQWRQTHCQSSNRQLKRSDALTVAVNAVPSEGYQAYVRCLELNSVGLQGRVEVGEATFTLFMLYRPLFDKDDSPRITDFTHPGATCPPLQVQNVPYGGYAITCQVDGDAAVPITLNTQKGVFIKTVSLSTEGMNAVWASTVRGIINRPARPYGYVEYKQDLIDMRSALDLFLSAMLQNKGSRKSLYSNNAAFYDEVLVGSLRATDRARTLPSNNQFYAWHIEYIGNIFQAFVQQVRTTHAASGRLADADIARFRRTACDWLNGQIGGSC